VEVFNLPVARFVIPDTLCGENAYQFMDSSYQPGNGSLALWTWTVNNASFPSSQPTPFTFPFTAAGNYSTTLQVQNSRGCVSPPYTRTFTLHEEPSAGFILPEVCLNDAFAEFRDSSLINGNEPLRYAWSFGDGGTSDIPSPRHKYNAAANYQVTQVVSTAHGCVDTLVRKFTVNGAVPRAAVALQTAGPLCSNGEIVLQNNSSVDFGDVTRLEIYWDAAGAPNLVEADELPSPGKTYRHAYPEFGTPASRNYSVLVRAYSGATCFNDFTLPVTMLASPQIVFDSIPGLCQESAPIQLSAFATETSGIAGNASFSGPGVRPDGTFDPTLAGPGTHRLRYTYSATNGCSAFLERQLIVYPTPLVDAGPDRTVLEGGFITLNATASGNGLQYRWTPSTGLNNPGLLNPEASPTVDTRYQLTVSSVNGCSAADEVFVRVLLKPVIPNTFTPNGDGYNDRWEIRSLDTYPGCIVEVYNTAGQLVFRSVGYNQPWDGSMNGKPLPAGTYYYVIDAKNGRSKVAGYVTLIK
jgi:gliding motility-associated-like protein